MWAFQHDFDFFEGGGVVLAGVTEIFGFDFDLLASLLFSYDIKLPVIDMMRSGKEKLGLYEFVLNN